MINEVATVLDSLEEADEGNGRNEIRDIIIETFDLDSLREAALNENNGIFKKFSDGIIEGYKNKCMKNKVSFKKFCFYVRKNAADFKAELE